MSAASVPLILREASLSSVASLKYSLDMVTLYTSLEYKPSRNGSELVHFKPWKSLIVWSSQETIASSVGSSWALKNPRINGDCEPSSNPTISDSPAGPWLPVEARPAYTLARTLL